MRAAAPGDGAGFFAVSRIPAGCSPSPDAIRQLEQLDRDLLIRRDLERLFGVSKVRAVALMTAFGAGRTGHLLTLPRAALLRQLRRHRTRAAVRGEETRRARVVTAIRQARLTGIRAAVPSEALDTGTLAGLRDRALVSVMLYSVARVSAVSAMRRQDYFRQERQGWLRLHEKGGTRHDVPAPHHRAAEALDDCLARAGRDAATAALFQSVDPAGRWLTGRTLSRRLVLAMIKRRAAAADLPPSTCYHTFRATGITAYLSNGGTLEHAQQIAGHASPKTTKLYDRTADTITVDEIRAHRDLGGGRPARRRAPRDVRAESRDGRAARFRVRHVGCRMARTLDSVLRLRLFSPGGWGVSAARRWRVAPTRVGALW